MAENPKQIIYYKTSDGKCPYIEWKESLDTKTQSIIDNRIERLIDGLYGDHKKLSNSMLSELRFFVGKGYRVYYKDLTNVVNGINSLNKSLKMVLFSKFLTEPFFIFST